MSRPNEISAVVAAAEMAAGTFHPTERVGRAGSRARMAEGIASALGTTGTLVIGGTLLALCLAWLIYELKHVHPVITRKQR